MVQNAFLHTLIDIYQHSSLPEWLRCPLVVYSLGSWSGEIVPATDMTGYDTLDFTKSLLILREDPELNNETTQKALVVVSAALLVDPTQELIQACLKRVLDSQAYTQLCELLSAIAAYRMWLQTYQAAPLLDLPQLYKEHPTTYQQRLLSICTITEAFLQATTSQEVVDITIRQGINVCGASAGLIMEVDQQLDQLRLLSYRGYPNEMIAGYKTISLNDSYPLTRAYHQHQHLFLTNVYSEPEIEKILARYTVAGTNPHVSWAVLLLQTSQEIVGVLGLSFDYVQQFSRDDQLYMETLAHQCALALERTRLFEAEQRAHKQAQISQEHLRFLSDTSSLFNSSLDVHAIKRMFSAAAVRYFADWCGMYMLNGVQLDQLVTYYENEPVTIQGELLQRTDLLVTVGIGRVLETGQPEWYPQIQATYGLELNTHEPLFQTIPDKQVHSYMVVPLSVRGHVIGVLGLALISAERTYSVLDLELATQLANNAATAIDNAQLYAKACSSEQGYRDALSVLDALLQYAPVGMAFWNRERHFVRVNAALAEINNLPIEAHLERTIKEVWPNAQLAFSDALEAVYTTGSALIDHEISTHGLVPRSQERFWLVNFYPVINEQATIIGVGGIITDITERKQTEEKWRFLAALSKALTTSLDSEQMLSQVTNLLVPEMAEWCAILLIDELQELQPVATAPTQSPWIERYLWVHEHLTDQLQFDFQDTSAALLDQSQPELWGLLEQAGFSNVLVSVLNTRDSHLGLLVMANISLKRSFLPIDLQVAEETAQRLALALDNANLYAAAQKALLIRDQFVSVAAHELKTPMTTMIGYAQLLKRRLQTEQSLDTERSRRAIQAIYEQTERLHRLVLSMLDLTRIQLGQLTIDLQEIDLVQLVKRIVSGIEPTLEHHQIILDVPAHPVIISGDELRMEQVIQNLVSNGVKYSIEGGDVVIRLLQTETNVLLAVRDHGVGIPSTDVQNLFTRFYRASNTETSVSGMGLGLYIVREIIERHGGVIRVDSVEYEGSTFTIILPCSAVPQR